MFLLFLPALTLLASRSSLLVTGTPIDTSVVDTSHQLVYQFDTDTWIENLAVRANGNISVILITSPEVWEVNPSRGTAELVATFPNASSALGITEVEPEVFAVVLGAWNIETLESTPGSYSVWQLDYTGFLNGITPLATQNHTVLIADSYQGVVYSLNTNTGAHKIVIDAPELKPKPGAVAKLGVNGIHYRQGYLYFTNSFNVPVLGRFRLNPNGIAASAVEIILAKPTYPTNAGGQADDFAFDQAGNVWLTTDPSNTLLKVELPSAAVAVVAGGIKNPLIAGDTASAFGRTAQDQDLLYVVTNGGLAYPTPGGVGGGKVVAFKVQGLAA